MQARLAILYGAVWLRRGRRASLVARSLLLSYRAWGRFLPQQLAHPYARDARLGALQLTHGAYQFLAALQLRRLHVYARAHSQELLAFGRWRRRSLLRRSFAGFLGQSRAESVLSVGGSSAFATPHAVTPLHSPPDTRRYSGWPSNAPPSLVGPPTDPAKAAAIPIAIGGSFAKPRHACVEQRPAALNAVRAARDPMS